MNPVSDDVLSLNGGLITFSISVLAGFVDNPALRVSGTYIGYSSHTPMPILFELMHDDWCQLAEWLQKATYRYRSQGSVSMGDGQD